MNAIDHFRLGLFRRNKRDYSLHQRAAGKDAGDRMRITELSSNAESFLLIGFLLRRREMKKCEANRNLLKLNLSKKFVLLNCLLLQEASDLNIPRLLEVDFIPKVRINYLSFSDQYFAEHVGWSRDDVKDLSQALLVPEYFILNKGKHRFKVFGEHAFLYYLFRMKSASARMAFDEREYHYDYSVLSKMVSAVVKWLNDTHGGRLNTVAKIIHKFQSFNAAYVAKFKNLYPGEDLTAELVEMALLTDGTRFEVSIPQGADWKQRACFSGDKWYHCHGALVTVDPSGMIRHWFDDPVGRHNDRYFLRESRLNNLLQRCQLGNAVQYGSYTDKGFDEDTHISCAAHGPAYVSPRRKLNSKRLTPLRVTNEWCIGKVYERNPYLRNVLLLKLQQTDVAALVKSAVIITNCHTCMHQSNTGLYFNVIAPTLADYLQ